MPIIQPAADQLGDSAQPGRRREEPDLSDGNRDDARQDVASEPPVSDAMTSVPRRTDEGMGLSIVVPENWTGRYVKVGR